MSDIKKLMGDSISEETALALQTILDESLKEKQDEIDALQIKLDESNEDKSILETEVTDLKEEHKKKIEFISEKADEFAEQVRQDAIDETTTSLQEAFDAREAFLIEKAESYGEFLIEKAEKYGDHLIERGEAYGARLIEKAEAYGEHLIEQADLYGEKIEETQLAEAEATILEFKTKHLEEFKRLDEHNRMATVFSNLKTLIESSGFSIDEASQVDSLQEELREQAAKARAQARVIRSNETELKKFRVAELIEKTAVDLTFKDKERIISTVMKTRCETVEELSEVVKTLVENNVINNNNGKTKSVITESEEAELTKTVKGSGWGGRIV